MKRFLGLVLIIGLAIVLASCGTTQQPDIATQNTNAIVSAAEPMITKAINAAASTGTDINMTALAAQIAAIPHVSAAVESATDSAIVVKQDDGSSLILFVATQNDSKIFTPTSVSAGSVNHAAPAAMSFTPQEYPLGKKALILAPMQSQFNAPISKIKSELTSAGFTVDVYENAQAGVDKFKGSFLEQYDVVIIDTHGAADGNGTYLLTGTPLQDRPLDSFPADLQPYLASGSPGGTEKYVVVSNGFIRLTASGNFRHTFVFVDACDSAYFTSGAASLATTLFDLGAGGYGGWSSEIAEAISNPTPGVLLGHLLSGESLANAISATQLDPTLLSLTFVANIAGLNTLPNLHINIGLLTSAQRLSEPYYLVPPTSGGTAVNVTKVGTVPWLAVQDGTSAWQALSGSSFTVSDSGGRYGVAWECAQSSGQPLVHVTQETTADSTAVTASCPTTGTGTPPTYTVSATISGIPAGGSAAIALGNNLGSVSPSSPTYALGPVAAGSQTLLAFGTTSSGAYDTMVRSKLTVNSNLSENINLSAGAPITSSNSLSLMDSTGVPSGEMPLLAVELASAAAPPVIFAFSSSSGLAYPVVPGALTQTGDKYLLIADVEPSSSSFGAYQGATNVSQSPTSSITLQVPPALSASANVNVTSNGASVNWGSASFSSSGLTAYVAMVTPLPPSSAAWTVTATAAWMGSATSYAFPDFSTTTGWNTSWDFPSGASAYATVEAAHANVTPEQMFEYSQTLDRASLPSGTSLKYTGQFWSGTY